MPKSYLELLIRKEGRLPQNTAVNDFMGQPLLPLGLSFSSVDYISPNTDYHPLQSIPEGVTINFTDPGQGVPKKNHIRFCKALYDFGGKNSSELSFSAGDIIKVLRTKTPSGGDDGWWEGEYQGRVGLFPSLVVEPVVDVRNPLGSPFKSPCSPPERLEIVEFDTIHDTGLSKVKTTHSHSIQLKASKYFSPCPQCDCPM